MMISLAKRWNNETSSFHLSTGEETVTLEDMWRIHRLPIHGECVIYDMDAEREAYYDVMGLDEIIFCEGQIDLERYRLIVSPFQLVIAAII